MASMNTTQTLRMKNDASLRRRFFVPESFSHPAKMHCGLFLEIIARYCKPGDLLCDPMAGSGTCLLAAQYGIDVVAVELEQHFVSPMRQAWAKIQQHGPALGHQMGEAVILRGDARALPLGRVDSCVFSPPYEGSITLGTDGIDWARSKDGDRSQNVSRQEGGSRRARGYARPVNAVVTSPPYERGGQGLGTERHPERMWGSETGLGRGYTRPVDAVITSPPYEQIFGDGHKSTLGDMKAQGSAYQPVGQSHHGDNIGNQRGDHYWQSMRQVCGECYRVLAPGGLMVLVLKGYTRDGQYVDLPQQTRELVESLGFQSFDQWERELWNLSFWRILQQRRDPAAFDNRLRFEQVQAYRRTE